MTMITRGLTVFFVLLSKGSEASAETGSTPMSEAPSTTRSIPYLGPRDRTGRFQQGPINAPVLEVETEWVILEDMPYGLHSVGKGARSTKYFLAACRLAKKLEAIVAPSKAANRRPREALVIFLSGFATARDIDGGLLLLAPLVKVAKDMLRNKAGLACNTRNLTEVLSCLWGRAFEAARVLDGGCPLSKKKADILAKKTEFVIRAHAAARDVGRAINTGRVQPPFVSAHRP